MSTATLSKNMVTLSSYAFKDVLGKFMGCGKWFQISLAKRVVLCKRRRGECQRIVGEWSKLSNNVVSAEGIYISLLLKGC